MFDALFKPKPIPAGKKAKINGAETGPAAAKNLLLLQLN